MQLAVTSHAKKSSPSSTLLMYVQCSKVWYRINLRHNLITKQLELQAPGHVTLWKALKSPEYSQHMYGLPLFSMHLNQQIVSEDICTQNNRYHVFRMAWHRRIRGTEGISGLWKRATWTRRRRKNTSWRYSMIAYFVLISLMHTYFYTVEFRLSIHNLCRNFSGNTAKSASMPRYVLAGCIDAI